MKKNNSDENLNVRDLLDEIENFKKEKERVRAIVGNIGGMPTVHAKLFNIFFAVLIVALLIAGFFLEGRAHQILLDVALTALSVKIIYLIHSQARVNHFQLWILSSLEWKLNELDRLIRKEMKGEKDDK